MFIRQKSSAHLCFSLGKAPGKYLWKPAPSATYWILRWERDEQKKLWWRCWSERKWGCSCSLGDLPSRCVAPMYCVNAAVMLHILISTCWVLPWLPPCLTRARVWDPQQQAQGQRLSGWGGEWSETSGTSFNHTQLIGGSGCRNYRTNTCTEESCRGVLWSRTLRLGLCVDSLRQL